MKVTVIAHVNAKKPRIEQDLFGALNVYVNAPALEGKANRAIIVSLAEHFNIKKSQVILLKGERSKHKIFEIEIK